MKISYINQRNRGIENFVNLTKNIYLKKTTIPKITCNSEKLDAFSLRLETRQGCAHSPLLFNVILEVLTNTVRLDKEIIDIQIGRKK